MKGVKFIVPAIILVGVVVFQSLFVVQEISQAIVLQFGDPKKIVTKAGLHPKKTAVDLISTQLGKSLLQAGYK